MSDSASPIFVEYRNTDLLLSPSSAHVYYLPVSSDKHIMLTASTTMGAVPLTTSTTPLVSSTVHQTVFRLRFDSAVTRLTPVTTTTSVTTGTLPWYIYQTPLVEIINTTRVTIGAPYDCDGFFWGRELRPNPDISGVGVVFAFMLSAWLVWLITVYAFARGQIDASQVTSADTRFFRVQVKSSGWRWSSVFLRAILVFSDQQLVTGIAIMIATFASCQDISVWHYAFAVSLAWVSHQHYCSLKTQHCVLD
uniref:Elsinochromes biosynthesis cluster protein HP3 n=1 Tax=Elsinoe fawcettii TaxID=40997 RepID=HP3_ELSFA|nr:RecName: Full=Elsinochromes biosynthesis cluster protein HP3 [Elsinoe fawcettii]ABZ82011.1 hypothetical protein EfHP3 [Elsinoe fawcettii]